MNAAVLQVRGKSVRDGEGRVMVRVKRRDMLPVILRAPAAMKLLHAISAISRKRDLNAMALNEIARQEQRLAEAKQILLDQRKTIEQAMRDVHGAATTFLQSVQ